MIGWSEDETYYAIRLYALRSEVHYIFDGAMELPRDCEGYVSHTGKPFDGGLSLHIYKGDSIVANFPIQDADTCTSLAEAKKRLQEAKRKIREMGICLNRPGRELLKEPNNTFTLDSDSSIVLEYRFDLRREPLSGFEQHHGTHTLSTVIGGKRCEVLKRSFEERFWVGWGHRVDRGVESVFVSPSGKKVLVYVWVEVATFSGLYKKLELLGTLQRNGETLTDVSSGP